MHHKRLQIMLAAQSKITKINGARHQAGTDEKEESQEDSDGPQLMDEAKSALENALGINANPPDKLDLTTRVGMLNADQRRTFDRLKQHFLHQKDMKM